MTRNLVFAMLIALSTAATPATAQDTIYTWIDENGVVRYTNTLPPEGARIIDKDEEIPHDAEQARQREIEQRRFIESLEKKAPEPAQGPEEKSDRQSGQKNAPKTASGQKPESEEDSDDRNRRNETYHQDQIEKRRAKELREQKFGSSPVN